MEKKWCWRCQMEVPMLNEEEFAIAYKLYAEGAEIDRPLEMQIRFKSLLDYYRKLTGEKEKNPNAIMHHRVRDYGPDCPECKKPLRTPIARFCAACGFGK